MRLFYYKMPPHATLKIIDTALEYILDHLYIGLVEQRKSVIFAGEKWGFPCKRSKNFLLAITKFGKYSWARASYSIANPSRRSGRSATLLCYKESGAAEKNGLVQKFTGRVQKKERRSTHFKNSYFGGDAHPIWRTPIARSGVHIYFHLL